MNEQTVQALLTAASDLEVGEAILIDWVHRRDECDALIDALIVLWPDRTFHIKPTISLGVLQAQISRVMYVGPQ